MSWKGDFVLGPARAGLGQEESIVLAPVLFLQFALTRYVIKGQRQSLQSFFGDRLAAADAFAIGPVGNARQGLVNQLQALLGIIRQPELALFILGHHGQVRVITPRGFHRYFITAQYLCAFFEQLGFKRFDIQGSIFPSGTARGKGGQQKRSRTYCDSAEL